VLAVLDVPVLAELLAAAVLRKAEEEAARERDPGALVPHDRPPLDDDLPPLDDGWPKRRSSSSWVEVARVQ
jgi:hypothetical protein